MDWLPMAQQDYGPRDLEVFKWRPKGSRFLKMMLGNATATVRKDLTTEAEWNEWLSEDTLPCVNDFKKGLAVILAGRADDITEMGNPVLLRYLPWTKETFREIVKRMQIKRSTLTAICNGGVAMFNRTYIVRKIDGIPAIVYNLRTMNSWVGDMALSMTYIPSTHSTYAIVYGCSPETIREITRRLSLAGDAICHPLLLPGIFAELERERHFDLVQNGLTQRLQFVTNLLQNNTYDCKSRGVKEEDMSTTDSVDLWIAICHLRNGLKKWKQQLVLMAGHVDELSQTHCQTTVVAQAVLPGATHAENGGLLDFDTEMRKKGAMIKERLAEIMVAYDEKVRDCNMIMEGMTMATQLAHTKANMEIAVRTRRDGSQMRSIALLTMIFLPATFVATVFSMTFFTWEPNEGQGVVSPWFWVYVVIAVGLTLITVGLWFFCVNRGKAGKENPAKQLRELTQINKV